MNHVPTPQYGYELTGETDGQRRLLCGPCDIEQDGYLARFCGSCSADCGATYVDEPGIWDLVTPLNPQIPELLRGVGGLDLTTPGTSVDLTGLPSSVDLVTPNRRSVAEGQPVYAVSPAALFRRRLGRNGATLTVVRDVRRRLGLDSTAKLLLTGNALDELLQWWWYNSPVAVEAVRANRFDWVLSPNYSVYGVRCPLEWAYNLKRSILGCAYLRDAGQNAVPTLMLPNRFFRLRVEEWLWDNPQVNCIATNLQMMQDDGEFQAALDGVARLDEDLGHRIHFIITGPTTQERIALVRRQLAHVTVVSSATLNGPSAYGGFTRPGAALFPSAAPLSRPTMHETESLALFQ